MDKFLDILIQVHEFFSIKVENPFKLNSLEKFSIHTKLETNLEIDLNKLGPHFYRTQGKTD